MLKNSLYFLALLALGTQAQAQEKINVAFIPTAYDTVSISTQEASNIHESIVNSFVKSKRFTVVDRSNLKALEDEKRLQRTEAFMDSKETFTDGVSKGASFLIEGNILSVSYNGKKDKWTSELNIQLKILDVSTGEIVKTEIVNTDLSVEKPKGLAKYEGSKGKRKLEEAQKMSAEKKSREEAFVAAMSRLGENVSNFTTTHFPAQIELVEWVGKDLKSKVSQSGPFFNFVLAAGGNFGMEEEQLLDVVTATEVEVGGKIIVRQSKIASATIIRVDDANFSTARLMNGIKEVKKAVLNNEKLTIITK